jgi:hypothetical protein
MGDHIMPEKNQLWTMKDVAGYLNYKPDTFRKKREQLEEDGFPEPVIKSGGLRWSPDQIKAWEKSVNDFSYSIGGNSGPILSNADELEAASQRKLNARF